MTPTTPDSVREKDPWGWMLLILGAFAALAAYHIDEVGVVMFDEKHYLPAARHWIALDILKNPEHPLLGKQLLALSMMVFGDNAIGWRAGSLIFAALALWATMRMTWLASRSRFAALAAGVFAATNFMLLVQARIAMLDTYMIGFVMLACWSLVAAVRSEGAAVRLRVILAGLLFGFAFATKWNVAPVIAFAGIAVFVGNLRARNGAGRRPLGRMHIIEAFVWLAVLPLAVYFASYETIRLLDVPNRHYTDPFTWQRYMLDLQESVVSHHTYMSNWWQWVLDWRPIWYFYEEYGGAWRGLFFIGNPLQMWTGLAALLACLWLGVMRQRMDCLAVFGAWLAALALWIIAPKPVQFYYHYLICGQFLAIALALALDAVVWRQMFAGNRWGRYVGRGWAVAFLVANTLLFAWFVPVLTTMPLAGRTSFLDYAWLPSWR